MYERRTYSMNRFEIIVPSVDNEGYESNYLPQMRIALRIAGYTGWTEIPTTGYWNGKLEPGTMLVIYTHAESLIDIGRDLGRIARNVMTDQDAIQVVVCPVTQTLIEA